MSPEASLRRDPRRVGRASIGRLLPPNKQGREAFSYFPNSFVGGVLRSWHSASCIDRLLKGARRPSEGLWARTPEATCCGVDKDAQEDATGRQDHNSPDRGPPPGELYSETNDNSLWPPPHHYAPLMVRDSKLLVPMGPTQSQTRAVKSQNMQP